VVIESDDWGKNANNPNFDFPNNIGTRTDWSFDQLESENELEKLYEILEDHVDSSGNKAKLTANFIVANPDPQKTKEQGYHTVVLGGIDENKELLKAWHSGMQKKVFHPQYHGRLHYNSELYLESIKSNSTAELLFNNNVNGGLENFVESQFEYYSEYQNHKTNALMVDAQEWVQDGLLEFKRIFGFYSKSTIAPNYVIPDKMIEVLSTAGVKYIQGGNKMIYFNSGSQKYKNYALGTTLKKQIIALARNVKFEPCRSKKEWQVDFCKKSIDTLFGKNIPVVIDTHRFNYVGKHANRSRKCLSELLDHITTYDVRFLTSDELGEAIGNKGNYKNAFTGEVSKIHIIDNPLKKILRNWVS
jgi:hypothetical protein